MDSMKKKGILASVVALVVFVAVVVGLYMLGGADESALERLRDIAIIFIVLLGAISVVLLAGITVALILLFIELKDHALPILDETTSTLSRVRGTANFVSEEAVKPIMTVAGKAAKVRAMSRVMAGKQKTPPMG